MPRGKKSQSSADLEGLEEYDLENYDDEEATLPLFTNVEGLMYYRDNNEDPYITVLFS